MPRIRRQRIRGIRANRGVGIFGGIIPGGIILAEVIPTAAG